MSGSSSTGTPISATPIEPGRPPGGCARGGLIGCGVAALAVLALMAAFLVYARRNPEALTDLLMGQIERNLAADVTPEEKERLLAAYREYRQRLQDRRAGREPVERLRRILSSAPTGSVSREQVRELTRSFEADASAPSEPATTALPAPSPVVTP